MSEHAVPFNPEVPELVLAEALAQVLRPPAYLRHEGASLVIGFVPDLSPAEADTFSAVVARATAARRTHHIGLTNAEYAAIEDDIAGLRTYYGLASPTNAQSVAAIKAIIAVLRALLRD